LNARKVSAFPIVSVEKNRTYCTDVLPASAVTSNGAAYAVVGAHVFVVSVQYAVTPHPAPPVPSEHDSVIRASFAVQVADAYAPPPGGEVALIVVVAVCLSI
jgi:hypothetical protein